MPTPGKGARAATAKIEAVIRDELGKAARTYQQRMQARLRGPTGKNTLSRRTGALARSVKHTLTKLPQGFRLTLSVGANAPYAIVHEEGRTITPKKAKYLAIPLAAAKTSAGVARLASPRLDPTLKFIMSRSGKKLLVRMPGTGKRARIVPHYVLKDSVQIPPRLGFKREARAVLRETLMRLRARTRALTKGGA